MHSKIIQLEKCPIENVGRIKPSDYDTDHWFTVSIADYVDDDDDPNDTLETLVQVFEAGLSDKVERFRDAHGKGLIFRDGFARAYLEREYKAFEQGLRNLTAKATVEAYCEDKLEMCMYQLNEAYNDKYGYYIQNEDRGLVTLTSFVRSIKPDTKYYFGGTVDYHF